MSIFLWSILLGRAQAEPPLSLEELRPPEASNLPDFRKYRQTEGPYYFAGIGQQYRPLSGLSAFSFSYQLARTDTKISYEIGLRLSETNPEEVITFDDRTDMYFNKAGEFVQNVFLGSADVFQVYHFLQPTTQWSLQTYIGSGFHISRHVYYQSDEEQFLALRWKGFSSMPSHMTRLPEIPLILGVGGQGFVYEDYGFRMRYLHSFSYKKTPEEELNEEPKSRDIYQYAMLVLDVFYVPQ